MESMAMKLAASILGSILAMEAVQQAKSGHPAMPMDMADIATVPFIVEQAANEEGLVHRTSIQAGASAHFRSTPAATRRLAKMGLSRR